MGVELARVGVYSGNFEDSRIKHGKVVFSEMAETDARARVERVLIELSGCIDPDVKAIANGLPFKNEQEAKNCSFVGVGLIRGIVLASDSFQLLMTLTTVKCGFKLVILQEASKACKKALSGIYSDAAISASYTFQPPWTKKDASPDFLKYMRDGQLVQITLEKLDPLVSSNLRALKDKLN